MSDVLGRPRMPCNGAGIGHHDAAGHSSDGQLAQHCDPGSVHVDRPPARVLIDAHIDEAAKCLFRSMESESSMCREHFVRMAARLLFTAAALADGEERRTLSRYFGQAQALAVFFYGDGRGVSRLHDELRAMTGERL